MTRLSPRLLLFALVAIVVSAGCGAEDTEQTTAEVDCGGPPGEWLDETTGLIWEEPPNSSGPGYGVGYYAAIDYCDCLGDGWRVPTINELRSLIRGCASSEPDGTCLVDDPDCLDWTLCLDGCDGCPRAEGPGGDGCYWPDELSSEWCFGSRNYWSISGGSVAAFEISFDSALVGITNHGAHEYAVRCVKDE